MKISIITPAVREDGLAMLRDSLRYQDFDPFNYEWIVCSPFEYKDCTKWISDPPLNKGDLYGYHKAMNDLIRASNGELIICVNDMTALFPDVLKRFWEHHLKEPMNIYCGLANPETTEEAKKYGDKWLDVRWKQIHEDIQPTTLTNFDTALSGIPKEAFDEIGYPYIDPIYDQFACWGDREMLVHIMQKGYKLFIDSKINFYGYTHMGHPQMKDWDERFQKGERFFVERNGTNWM